MIGGIEGSTATYTRVILNGTENCSVACNS